MSLVDERIVKMVFDNADFTNKITSTIGSITQLNKATDSMADNSRGINAMSNAFQQAEITSTQAGFHIRDVWLKVASVLEYQIAGKIVNVAKQITNAMTFEGINDGFREYELKMGSVQTIMAGTGESLATVNKYLEELNTYSDKTIYSFADMTNNIGKFTNAGVKLEDAVAAIKGIANEAAISGANANEASRAMYNFSQALSAGYVKLIDWKSIENANMATLGFKETLLEVASTCGTVEKDASGMYKVLTTNAQGKSMEELVSGTKNFNDSLQQQWMTTEVLTKALKIYATNVEDLTDAEKEAYEEELRAMGLSDEQIKKFEELGTKATKAASEVKTFSMLIDTLKEAIGSGWAQTWEILIGDFEEAKQVWTAVSDVLGGIIDKQAKARNDLLKGWDALGGRIAVLKSIKNLFDAVVNIAKPVSEAMKTVFPPVTVDNLLAISTGLKEFTQKLKDLSEKIAPKVQSIATGFFSLLHIGVTIVKAFIGAITPAGTSVGNLASILLDVGANIGDFLDKLDVVITKSKLFETVFELLATIIKKPFEYLNQHRQEIMNFFTTIANGAQVVISFLGTGLSGVISLFSSLYSGIKQTAGPMESIGDIFKKVFDDLNGGLDNVKAKIDKLKPFFEGLKSVFEGIGRVIGAVFKEIGNSLTGISFSGNGINGLMNLINALVSGGILYQLYNGIKQFSSIGDSFAGVLEGLGNALDGFGKKAGSEALLNAAKAVGILAASLFAVAMIDTNKLAGATAAISAMIITLSGAMAILMKAVNSFSSTEVTSTFSVFGRDLFGIDATKTLKMAVTLTAVSKALVAMGEAVLLMSVGLKLVASVAKEGHLWESFAVVSLMLAELTVAGLAMSKFGGDKAVKGLTSMSAALVVLAAALKIVSSIVEDGNAWESLGILSIMLGELGGIAILIEAFGKYKMTGMTALISLAVSLNLCVIALKQVSDALGNEGNHIWESLGIISIMLAELAAITVVMSKFGGFAALGGAGAIMAAAALLIMVQSLKQVSDALGQTDQHIWEALGVIGASLVVLAVGLTAMAGSIPGAAGLLVASAGLIVLGGALKIIGSLSLAEIGKGLLAMAGSLVVLAVGLTAMIVALPGAVALTVAAAGLTILAGALKIFASMGLGEIIASLGTLALAITGIAVIGTVLSVASPFLLAFSAALLVFGAAMAATGAGLTLFSAGMQALVAVVPLGTAALSAFATTILELLPVAIEKLMDALAILAEKIVEHAPKFGEAVLAILKVVLEVISGAAVQIGETVTSLLIALIGILTDKVPEFAKAGADFMIALMQAISTEIPRVVDEGYKCAIALINGLADAIEENNDDLIEAVDHLMNAAIQAITQWLVEFTPLGLLIPEDMKEGIMSGEFNVKDALDDLIKNAVEAIKKKVADFKAAAEDLIGGFIEGLKGTWAGKAVSAAAEFGKEVIEGLKSKKGLDENSPSQYGIESGEYLAEGVEIGIQKGSKGAVEASSTFGNKVTKAMDGSLTGGSDDIMSTIKTLVNNVKGAMSETDRMTDSMKKNTVSAQKQAQMLELVTEETESHMTAKEKAAEAERKNTKETEKNTEAQEKNATATEKATKEVKTQTTVNEYASGVVKAFVKQYGDLYKGLGETGPLDAANVAIKQLAESTYLASLRGKEAVDANGESIASIEEMIKSFTALKDKIYDSVESVFSGEGFFTKFEVKTEKTMAEIIEAMHTNIYAVASWSDQIVALGRRGLDQGLLKQLSELGPKGYEYVNAFSHATTEQIEEANALFAYAAALPDSVSNKVVASYANAGLNVIKGFAGGIDDNAKEAYTSAEKLGLTTLSSLQKALEIHSPSEATKRDGKNLVMGLREGINKTSDMALRAASVMCTEIVSKIRKSLDSNIFYGIGRNVAYGLASGMNSNESLAAVRRAAQYLSEVASMITVNYNLIHSPSRRYEKYGGYIAAGLAEGMMDGVPKVQNSASILSEVVNSALETAEAISENDLVLHPVISPVLDLTEVRQNAGLIGSLFPERSMMLASSVGASMDASARYRAYNGNTNNTYTYGGANIYITARDGESADQIADRVISKLDRQTSRRKAVNGL